MPYRPGIVAINDCDLRVVGIFFLDGRCNNHFILLRSKYPKYGRFDVIHVGRNRRLRQWTFQSPPTVISPAIFMRTTILHKTIIHAASFGDRRKQRFRPTRGWDVFGRCADYISDIHIAQNIADLTRGNMFPGTHCPKNMTM